MGTETGENVVMRVEGSKLIIEVDLTHVGELSSTGKSRTVASTKGNKPVPGHDGIMIGLNVYKPVKGGRLDRTRGRRQQADTAPPPQVNGNQLIQVENKMNSVTITEPTDTSANDDHAPLVRGITSISERHVASLYDQLAALLQLPPRDMLTRLLYPGGKQLLNDFYAQRVQHWYDGPGTFGQPVADGADLAVCSKEGTAWLKLRWRGGVLTLTMMKVGFWHGICIAALPDGWAEVVYEGDEAE